MPVANRDFTRAINQYSILNEIRKAGRISRVEIADNTGQSRASVTNITALLLDQGLIREDSCTCPPSRGRRRIMLSLNPESIHVVGVKISAFQVSYAVVNFRGDVESSLIMPIRTNERPESYIADIIEDGVLHCVAQAKLSMSDISGIGIGIPGFVDSGSGICHWTPLYKKEKISLKDLIHTRLGVEVFIENDANSVTVGQQWFGQGVGMDNFIVVTIEHGVGMGIVVNGQMYRGATGVGAEFGHMVLVPDGEPCRCGKRGCIESYVSDMSLLRRAKEVLSRRKNLPFSLETLTIEDVNAMGLEGDAAIRKLFREGGDILGRGIAGLIHIFNPERLIVTGEGVRAGDMLFSSMRRAIQKNVNKEVAGATEFIVQEWADDDWARGAAGMVLSELYKSPLERIRRVP